MAEPAPSGESYLKIAKHYLIAIVGAVVLALFIRFFLIEAYRIPSSAMKPTLEAGDTIFVSKFSFGLRMPGFSSAFMKGRLPKRGEVVIFSLPNSPDTDYIKRVVAVAGDVIGLEKGRVILNGKSISDSSEEVCGKETIDGKSYSVCWEPPLINDVVPVKVPPGKVFVVGDMRTRSAADASKFKTWGLVDVRYLKGAALWTWLSVEAPSYGGSASWFSRIRFERMFRAIR